MKIKNLANIDLMELTECFNAAFADYSIPMQMTPSQLQDRFYAGGISYDLSFGAFDSDDRLVAFVMHCTDHPEQPTTVFNVGTGVIPSYRGQRLVPRIYTFAAPHLKETGIKTKMLEVIQTNTKAIKAYQSAGFRIEKELTCLKGKIKSVSKKEASIIYASGRAYQTLNNSLFWNYLPAWENSTPCILRNVEAYTFYFVQDPEDVCGYAVVHSTTGVIKQFGVLPEKRGKGFGQALFHSIGQDHDEVKILNIDQRDTSTLAFLEKNGLTPFVTQYEMHHTVF
ncbi:GNAT family N-acetyltransferase [Alkalicoccobacillus porphyridii]|uniref:GNAT family N-acetyltransferase n=1 Tax=Alkalicoccobacillus porphyridii TaxID=2597270 RepID=A0A553ZVZ7_9BACI|nr:GNAT family N-acetyltransferase [Alkalicoccobacillus porphyridii]TSB45486.1 GNAT family N-acetyltransferase [Alkalicoccobacillus porphyridii]